MSASRSVKLQGASADPFNPDFKVVSKKKAFYDTPISFACQSIRQCYLLNKIEKYRWGINNAASTLQLEPVYIKKVVEELNYLRSVICGTTDPRLMDQGFVKFYKNIKSPLPASVQEHWDFVAEDILMHAIRLRFEKDLEARTKLFVILPYPWDDYTFVLPAKTPGKPDDFVFGGELDDKLVLKGENYYGKALTNYVMKDLGRGANSFFAEEEDDDRFYKI